MSFSLTCSCTYSTLICSDAHTSAEAQDRAQQAAQQVAALEQEMQAMHMAQVQRPADRSGVAAAPACPIKLRVLCSRLHCTSLAADLSPKCRQLTSACQAAADSRSASVVSNRRLLNAFRVSCRGGTKPWSRRWAPGNGRQWRLRRRRQLLYSPLQPRRRPGIAAVKWEAPWAPHLQLASHKPGRLQLATAPPAATQIQLQLQQQPQAQPPAGCCPSSMQAAGRTTWPRS